MAIDDLPLPVVSFLDVIGVERPYANEDTVGQVASLVREFRQAVEQTRRDATAAVHGSAQAHQGSSTEATKSGWAHPSFAHVSEIVDGCEVLAVAPEGWAAEIVVQKGIAVAATPGSGIAGPAF